MVFCGRWFVPNIAFMEFPPIPPSSWPLSVHMVVSGGNFQIVIDCGECPLEDYKLVTDEMYCCLDTGLSKKVVDILSDKEWSSDALRSACLGRAFETMKESHSAVGGSDNREAEGDFSLMQASGQQVSEQISSSLMGTTCPCRVIFLLYIYSLFPDLCHLFP